MKKADLEAADHFWTESVQAEGGVMVALRGYIGKKTWITLMEPRGRGRTSATAELTPEQVRALSSALVAFIGGD